MSVTDRAIAQAIIDAVDARGPDKTCCPSEIARSLAHDPTWRDLMPRVRDVAADLARQGRIRISRGGKTVDPSNLSGGPVRFGPPGS